MAGGWGVRTFFVGAVVAAVAVAMGTREVAAQPAQRDEGPPPTAVAAVLAAQRPQIDGLDADAVWARSLPMDRFRQFDPEPDAEPSQRTEFRVAYDEGNLYVFVRAFDTHPDSIMRALSRRDVAPVSNMSTRSPGLSVLASAASHPPLPDAG
ncbi:MAG: hypothetical protein AMXMBFR53_02430 [Gemmatimonadota bacterium]